jgi:hypothetical protein
MPIVTVEMIAVAGEGLCKLLEYAMMECLETHRNVRATYNSRAYLIDYDGLLAWAERRIDAPKP